MLKQNGFTIVELIIVFVAAFGIGAWVWNAIKLESCDFKANYKCEALHGVGLVVPPLSIITVWFDDDGAQLILCTWCINP